MRVHSDERGFTFLEIMVVVIIIGLLTTLIGQNIFGRLGQAKSQIARTQIEKLTSALEFYKLDNGFYPTSEQGLEALVTEPSGEPRPKRYLAGGYVKKADIYDPWNQPFEYQYPGSNNSHSFDISSLGDDGQQGGDGAAADVNNWDESS